MSEMRLDPEYIALLDAWQDLQVQVQALEAENARLQTDLRATQEGYIALNLQMVKAQRALDTCQRARQESDDEMAREIRALKEQNTALRQPYTHTPPGSDPTCVLCRVRTYLSHRLAQY
jgi:regulator of replication initiation timing